ncbi:MAG: hypothetical protein JRJ20_17805, partial [Deltaproteobacteria bacterium]|nr:hypothetical protein [Deltaproteobacteria bacterium]
MTFRWKLFFSYLLIVLIPFLAAERYMASHLEDRLLQQIEGRLSTNALLLKGVIEKEYLNRIPSYELDALITKIGREVHERITFIDNRGNVLGDTEISPDDLRAIEDHSRRPEFIQAFKTGYGMATHFSTTLN